MLMTLLKEIGVKVFADKKLSTCFRLQIRMKDDVTVSKVIIVTLKWWKISNNSEQRLIRNNVKESFFLRKKLRAD